LLTAKPDIVKLLLPANATNTTTPPTAASGLINAVNDSGNTALHWAALNGHLESVKLLVQAGADVTIINKAGHDAVFEAEINDKGEVVDWLLAAVEGLEKGIGQGEEEDREGGEASDVEVVRSQMEVLDTKDGSQGG
jgi:ankyrin repeat protein